MSRKLLSGTMTDTTTRHITDEAKMDIKSRDMFKWAKPIEPIDTGKTRSCTQKTPVLCAFPSNREGFYNVWRFDTPGTMRIAFGLQADSRDDAISKALKNHEWLIPMTTPAPTEIK